MNYNDIEKCTKCNVVFDDLKFFIKLHIEASRKSTTGVWEPINNIDINSHEVICKTCFDEFAKNLERMNKENK